MTVVELGTNRLGGWRSLIAAGDRTLLEVKTVPLRVSLRTLHAGSGVEVVDNVLLVGEGIAIVASNTAVAITTTEGVPLVTAQVAHPDSEVALCRVELRPLGLAVWDDAEGLHVGSSLVAGNALMSNGGGVAIQLGVPPTEAASRPAS